MLFDLRSRGRRRAVKVIYSGLALVMVSGLLLVGVGTGGSGGLLQGLEGNGTNGTTGVNYGPLNAALKAVKANPNSATAWANLVAARQSTAGQGSNYETDAVTQTGAYTKSGDKQLQGLIVAWNHYQSLTKKPAQNTAILAARAYDSLREFSGAALAWQVVASAINTESAFACVAYNAYAAKEKRVAGLAAAKALALTPKAARAEVKTDLTEAKTSSAAALSC
jgi:hypothetical protein